MMTLTLGFRDTEERPDPHGNDKPSKHEESSITKICDHVWRRSGHYKRTQPGHCSRYRHTHHANIKRENFGGVGPSNSLPSCANDCSVQIDANLNQSVSYKRWMDIALTIAKYAHPFCCMFPSIAFFAGSAIFT